MKEKKKSNCSWFMKSKEKLNNTFGEDNICLVAIRPLNEEEKEYLEQSGNIVNVICDGCAKGCDQCRHQSLDNDGERARSKQYMPEKKDYDYTEIVFDPDEQSENNKKICNKNIYAAPSINFKRLSGGQKRETDDFIDVELTKGIQKKKFQENNQTGEGSLDQNLDKEGQKYFRRNSEKQVGYLDLLNCDKQQTQNEYVVLNAIPSKKCCKERSPLQNNNVKVIQRDPDKLSKTSKESCRSKNLVLSEFVQVKVPKKSSRKIHSHNDYVPTIADNRTLTQQHNDFLNKSLNDLFYLGADEISLSSQVCEECSKHQACKTCRRKRKLKEKQGKGLSQAASFYKERERQDKEEQCRQVLADLLVEEFLQKAKQIQNGIEVKPYKLCESDYLEGYKYPFNKCKQTCGSKYQADSLGEENEVDPFRKSKQSSKLKRQVDESEMDRNYKTLHKSGKKCKDTCRSKSKNIKGKCKETCKSKKQEEDATASDEDIEIDTSDVEDSIIYMLDDPKVKVKLEKIPEKKPENEDKQQEPIIPTVTQPGQSTPIVYMDLILKFVALTLAIFSAGFYLTQFFHHEDSSYF